MTICSSEVSRSSMGRGKIDKADRLYIRMQMPYY